MGWYNKHRGLLLSTLIGVVVGLLVRVLLT